MSGFGNFGCFGNFGSFGIGSGLTGIGHSLIGLLSCTEGPFTYPTAVTDSLAVIPWGDFKTTDDPAYDLRLFYNGTNNGHPKFTAPWDETDSFHVAFWTKWGADQAFNGYAESNETTLFPPKTYPIEFGAEGATFEYESALVENGEHTLFTEQELLDHVNYTDNWLVVSAYPALAEFNKVGGTILVSGAGEGNGTYTYNSKKLWKDGGDYDITFHGVGEVDGVEYGFWVLYNNQIGKAYWSEDDTTGLVFPTTGWVPWIHGDGGSYGGSASSPAPTFIGPPPEVTHLCVYDPTKIFTLAEWQYYDGLGSVNAQLAPAKDEAGDWIYDANNNLKLFPPV